MNQETRLTGKIVAGGSEFVTLPCDVLASFKYHVAVRWQCRTVGLGFPTIRADELPFFLFIRSFLSERHLHFRFALI
jgi:hypothetical protein